ncbi:MAG: lasso peptide biosynthesis B2 protein [Proteobacteria bacterium]|nr:MAG: lasso peptide biosynthesis B2 protein [Pseudomonadota bacterium]
MELDANFPLQRFRLAPGVHLAVADGFGVFLDLNNDDYTAVPLVSDAGTPQRVLDRLQPHLASLVEAGLLEEYVQAVFDLPTIPSRSGGIGQIFDDSDRRPFGLPGREGKGLKPSFNETVGVLLACRRASNLLQARSISQVVEAVVRRKPQLKSAGLRCPLQHHVEIFHRVRPLFPAPYLCLRDSLALIEYLAAKRCAIDWIFGVQMQPFGAHCWIASGNTLLNESVEFAAQFTPIMRV